jgi:excinuclease ABC subunit A
VSGSGKTTLVKDILYNSLKKIISGAGDRSGSYRRLEGDYSLLEDVEMIDQNPIGRSSRSNPATYTKSYDQIRALMAAQPLAKLRGYKPGFFSFNTKGGRCDVCEGEGTVSIDMQFLADITLECESCSGRRFKEEVLEITYLDKNIFEVLEMTVDEAMEFFVKEKAIINKIKPLQDVGLGYVQLGQSASTLSGGEAQRIKLASFLGRGSEGRNKLFIFDEPTTGLHFNDIKKLLKAFSALIDQGNTIISIEHNTEIIKSADWVIDLGPEGGDKGGELVFAGTPEGLVNAKGSFTGPYLTDKL